MSHKVRRVVLIHPPLRQLITAAAPAYIDRNRGFTPPVGLLYLLAAVEQSVHEGVLLDAHLEGWDHQTTARQALAHKPDLVGIQAMSFTLPDAYRVAKCVKSLDPSVIVAIGGPHPTIFPLETAALDGVDLVFAGEAEENLVALLDRLDDPGGWQGLSGIIALSGESGPSGLPDSGEVGQPLMIPDLDSLAHPARASTRYMRYTSIIAERNPITVMMTSRGCPFQCIFCNRMGRTYRYHSAEYVLDEIRQIVDLGIGEIFIHDDTFSLKRERVVAICDGIIRKGWDVIWEARTRVDCVDRDLLRLMARAGCHRLSFGVESGSERVLEKMRKNIDLGRVVDVFRWCREEGIITLADFMVGNLDETSEDVDKTLRLMRRLDPDYVQFCIASPYPGTPLYELAMERGVVEGDVWRDFARNPLAPFRSPVWTENFDRESLENLTRVAYRSFYFRPVFVWRQLRRIAGWGHLLAMIRAAFAILRG